ncbi:MAG TPA: glycoside hydrolase family 44 protein [Blastocatellia bacterium]|nr:glycoside hydrolase family 44 protein [Blastocatellia bacterium]
MNIRFRLVLSLLLVVSSVAPVWTARADNPLVTIAVDASANRHPINDLIYGLAYADASVLTDLRCPSNRRGGNNTTRYNWQQNADNRANDWYYESIAYASSTAGADADAFIGSTIGANSKPMITIPTVGWVAKLGPGRTKLSSFSISKYGGQTGNDWQWFPDAGNGIRSSNNQPVTGNDPNDASVPADSLFQQGWVQHLVSQWGTASNGGVKYYLLDNEPSIWHATHRDVKPTGANMEEIRDKTLDYAAKIKNVDANALVVGPEEWGWSGYLFSGYDQQWGSIHGWSNLPDRAAHGNWDYLPWLLNQLKLNNQSTGRRLLDVFSVHYYPQGGEFSDDVSTSMQLRRNRSTRSLWDPNYVDETWIADTVRLVPRLKEWVNTYYPGTQTAITEYNWGAEGHINGATAQADVLGIFGREGLDMASRWTTPDPSTPTYKAIKMYRNYDNAGGRFGETSVSATVPNPDNLSAFAAERASDGALTVMIVNKTATGNQPVAISLAGFVGTGSAHIWQLTSANAIAHPADVSFSGTTINTTVPPQSITMLVMPAAGAKDSAGIYVPASGSWFLHNANAPGPADVVFSYGSGGSGLVPLTGDWNGDGVATPGLYAPATGAFFLKNANAPGAADTVFSYGPGGLGCTAIAGDWNGDGTDTVGLYDPVNGAFFLKNSNAGGAADVVFGFGPLSAGWSPIVGDWDANGTDTIGLYNPSSAAFFLRNANAPGAADIVFSYGPSGAVPLAGDWNGDGRDTVGIYVAQTGTWFLRNTNSPGVADLTFSYGPPNVTPVVGNWDGN